MKAPCFNVSVTVSFILTLWFFACNVYRLRIDYFSKKAGYLSPKKSNKFVF